MKSLSLLAGRTVGTGIYLHKTCEYITKENYIFKNIYNKKKLHIIPLSTLSILGNFFLLCLLVFKNALFEENIFRNAIRESNIFVLFV